MVESPVLFVVRIDRMKQLDLNENDVARFGAETVRLGFLWPGSKRSSAGFACMDPRGAKTFFF